MHKLIALCFGLCLFGSSALALAASQAERSVQGDVLEMPNTDAELIPPRPPNLPSNGMTMAQVLRAYGEPAKRHAPVGGGTPLRPPITRWDYDNFRVYFEKRHVIHSVIPDAPVAIYHKNQLQPVH